MRTINLCTNWATFLRTANGSDWPETEVSRRPQFGRDGVESRHNSDIAEVKRLTLSGHPPINFAAKHNTAPNRCDSLRLLGDRPVRRREFITLVGGAVAWPLRARAQQPGKVPVIGFLTGLSPDTYPDRSNAFRKGLHDAGYIEGSNISIEYRWAEGHYDRLPRLAAELVDRKVAVIAAVGGPTIALAARAATTTIPIVFQIGVDPVQLGLVASLARPGGNITGITSMNIELGPKRVELIHTLAPAATDIALLVNPTSPTNAANDAKDAQAAASKIGVQLHVLQASAEDDFKNVFAKILDLQVGGLLLGTDALFVKEQLIAFSISHSLPTISPYRAFTEAGGLMSYGGDIADSWQLAGLYTGRVLKGDKPADLPVQQATKVQLVLNLKAAKRLGITIPETILARADEVIE